MPGATECRAPRALAAILPALVLAGLTAWPAPGDAGPLRERLATRQAAATDDDADEVQGARFPLPEGIVLHADQAYGTHPRQRFDVYAPADARQAPLLLLIHGGGWRRGDKGLRTLLEHKLKRWVPRGFIVVSANYRLVPDADPVEQAQDLARALAAVQTRAATWGGDGQRVILIGHSAGAHLAALLSADPARAAAVGVRPWLGSVLLDSGALDVPGILGARHLPLYDRAFGADPARWQAASPYHALGPAARPMLAVCSTQRAAPCPEAERFAVAARAHGVRVDIRREDRSHRDINRLLGDDPVYTEAVERFLRSLDPLVAARLAGG